ncbi:glucuronate isomerase [Paenibacillus sp. YYML68]|uniref:glucuronate isomerase n=1 Tax=Paenibacillus sp. YYML68 TaxID=2909250 RepID=UPI00249022D8|nr:glucuronate isomerase [Paenibacillus sp. YYML68]
MEIVDVHTLIRVVHDVINKQKITDMHTHLYPPSFGSLYRYGIDHVLTYHFLVNEYMRWNEISIEEFRALSLEKQADRIWNKLFIKQSPISEGARGVLTVLSAFGCDMKSRDLDTYRNHMSRQTPLNHLQKVLELSNVSHIIMTNDPFDNNERQFWLEGRKPERAYHASLRLDKLIRYYGNRIQLLRDWGYSVSDSWDQHSIDEVKRFLRDWIYLTKPVYMGVSLPPTYEYPEDSPVNQMLRDCVLPISLETGIPFALMIGTRTDPNHPLRNGSSIVGKAGIQSLERLFKDFPHNRFIVSMLSREDQHELTVLARKFNNLLIFGCWWFLNMTYAVEVINW